MGRSKRSSAVSARIESVAGKMDLRYQELVESLDAIVWRCDARTFLFTFVSQRAETILGYPSKRWITEPDFWRDHLHPEDRDWAISFCQKATQEKKPHEFEYRMIAADGRVVWLRDSVRVLLENGEPSELAGVMIDITHRKLADHMFRDLLEAAPDAIVVADHKGKIVLINAQAERLFGYRREELIGQRIEKLVPEHHRSRHGDHRAGFFANPQMRPMGINLELCGLRKDGTEFPVEISLSPLETEEGTLVSSTIRDVTERKRAEQALRESEARFRALFQSVPVGVVVSGPHAEVLSSNPAARDLLGVTEEQLLGTTSFDSKWNCTYEDGSPCPGPEHPIPQAIATRQPVLNMVLGVDRPALEDRAWLLVNAQPQVEKDGNVTQVICSFEDITNRKSAEERLRVSEARFRALSETAPAAIFVYQGSKFRYVNPALEMVTGYSQFELLKMNVWDLAHPDVRDLVRERALARQRGEPVPLRYEFKIVTKAGEERWLDFTDGNFELEGKPAMIGMAFDITTRKRAEEALRESEERWRAVFENSTVGISMTDCMSAQFQAANLAFQKMVGYSEEELRALSFMDITVEDDREPNRQLRSELLKGMRQSFALEKRYRRKDNSLIWVNLHVSLVPDTKSIPRFCLAIVEDITERKRAEEALLRSESYLAEGQRLSHTGSWALDVSSRELFWSQETYRIFGFDPTETTASINETFLQRIHPEDRPTIEDGLKAAGIQKASHGVDYRIVLPDGSIKHIHDVVYPVIDADGAVVERNGVIIDVTERKLAESALRESEQKYRTLFEESRDSIALTSREGRFIEFNQAALALYGYTRDELLRLKVDEIYANPDDRLRFRQEIEGKGSLKDFEVKLRKKDGTEIDCLITATVRRGDGGRIDGYQSVVRDITQSKQSERALRELTGRLLQLQDEERRHIARELHDTTAQELAALTTDLTLLIGTIPTSDPKTRNLIFDNLALAKKCARDIRTLSYLLHPPRLDEGGLSAALPELAEGFSKRRKIRVGLDLSPELGRLPQEVETALFRVVQESLNNIHRHSGSLTASIRVFRSTSEIRLEVRDAGHGIPPGTLNNFGKPTVRLGVGILGMRERLRQLGGSLEIISDGRGTCVKANLPLQEGEL